MSRSRRFHKLVLAILLLTVFLFVRTDYLVVRPGSAEDLSGLIAVEERPAENKGTFYLVTVSQQVATPALFLYALADPYTDLQPRRQVIPADMDQQEYNKLMRHHMEESQNLAKVIALRRAGFEVLIKSDGVKVVEVEEDSPAKGKLFPGDIILAVEGQRLYLEEEVISAVQKRKIGEPVTLTVRRGNETKEITIVTASHSEQPEKAGIRVIIQTLNWQPVLPLNIDMDVGKISGPSAGLMFVLEIINQISEEDLTAGHKIAGTGTINLREEVGAIGGVRQKVRAAEKAGAEYFLVPRENYADAKKAARHITLVPVENLDEALAFLNTLAQASSRD
ncbi:MAG: PDZ domain-containing protein [Firmicutes bacterium]|nr:PDZ domain-containing protein [Bacillota bacterium]